MNASKSELVADNSVDPPVRGLLHRPARPTGDGIVLAHGAGSNSHASLLAALGEAFAGIGLAALRIDLPYRQLRPYGPPGPGDAARDRAGLENAIRAMQGVATGRIFLGGHSYGGRQTTMLCAERPGDVAGLLLLSYPLHPPRKPEQSRTQHFLRLNVRALFVSGTRDPFGSPAEMQAALKLIPAETRLVTVDGAGHDLGFKGKARSEGLPALVLQAFTEFFGLSS